MYIRLDERIYMVAGGSGGPGISNYKDCNVYLIEGDTDAFLIDGGSGLDTPLIFENILETGCPISKIKYLFVTHAHGDHGGGVQDFQDRIPNLKVLTSAGEKRLLEEGTEGELGLTAAKLKGNYPKDYFFKHCKVDEVVSDGMSFSVADAVVTSITLPGHSIESVCYLVEKNGRRLLFSGDSIYLDGRLSLINCYGSTLEGYRNNIDKFSNLAIDALIPSHQRLTLQDGQKHVDKAIEFLKYSTLPPML